MSMDWSDYRLAAHSSQLNHQQALRLVEAQATKGHWQRINRWLPKLIGYGVAEEERQGSALAMADWLLLQHQSALAQELLDLVDWGKADADAWLLRGQAALSNHQIELAECHLIRALVLPGGRAIGAYRLGQLKRSQGQFDQAASWFIASLNCVPKPSYIHHELQFIRCSEALLPELVTFYEAMCVRQPNRALMRQMLSHYLMKKGDMKRAIQESRHAARMGLGKLRQFLAPATAEPTPPDFVILGAPKGGTTSVLRWLGHVPGLWCHPRKELNFFDGLYCYGPSWYCAQFPRFRDGLNILRGEATPNYFSHPEAAARIAALMPEARMVVLLRNPIDRAISWIEHLRRLEGLEGSTEHWLQLELQELELLTPAELASKPRIGTGALQDSCYDLHLQRWLKHLPHNPPLLLSSDLLFQQPEVELSRLLEFLGQPSNPTPWLEHWKPLNTSPIPPPPIPTQLVNRLDAFFSNHCEQSLTNAMRHKMNRPRPEGGT